jgi:endonuclease/exonuclease/phosphatase family metal-dependent hydrolase
MQFRDPRTRWQFLPGRRLLFEELERRDLLAVMRIVDWNTMNGPNDATADANYRTIFQAIGNETVQGDTQRIDILALQETDGAGPGGDSIGRVQNVLNSLYSTTSYNVSVSPMDGGGDSTGFVYDSSTVTLLNSVQVAAGALTHNVMRGEFQPVGSPASAIFYVYSIHLKSGDTGSDATTRGTEAATLRADADALGEGTQVMFVGDFNMHTSAEAGWTSIVAAGAGQLQDVADAPGDWNDNAAFKSLHSQDPQTTMDDRFDIQFASGEFFDGGGVDYVPNSFHIFGNNGTHTLNQPITTGTGASPDVLNALVAASDHLPAVGDYRILASTPSVRISETLGGTKVVEGGLYDTYQMVLNTVPTANVVVTVTPDSQVDVGNGAGVAKQFTFTPANALTPQTVVVHAVDDAIGEGNHSGLITHSAASSDAAYNGLSINSVNVSIVDNDAPAFVINEADVDQTGTDTTEFVELYDGGVGHASLNGKSLALFRGSDDTAYTVVTFGPSDFTDANGFFVIGDSALTPTPNKQFTTASNSIQQGPGAIALYSGSFTVGSAVTTTNLIDALVYDTGQADDAGLLALLLPGQPQINENQNSLGTTQSMSRVPDGISTNGGQRETATYVEQTPTPSAFNQALPFGVLVLQSGGGVSVAEGGATDSYQIALQSIPTANVQITVDPDNQTDLGLGAGVAIVLTFTPANALIPQTVNVTAVDDASVEGNHTSTITNTLSSADTRYNGLVVPNVIAAIADNDIPAPTSIVISELMYNPVSGGTSDGGEWIEIVNTGAASTDLTGWLFDDEDATNWGAIPSGTVLSSGQVAVFFDSSFTDAATFRSAWSVPASALVVGVSWGSLGNSPAPGNEVLQLLDNHGVSMDLVNYDDASPWPTQIEGRSIYLTNLSADNNAGANWARSVSGTAKAVSASGPTFSTSDVGSPGRFFLPADYNSNGSVDAGDYVVWRKTLSSTTNLQADGSGPSVGVPNGVVDQADYTYWRSNFGGVGAASGAGSDLGSGESFAASGLSEPAPTVSLVSEQPPQAADNSAIDAAVVDLSSPPIAAMSTSTSRAIRQPTSPTAGGSSVDSLLSILRPALTTRPADDSLNVENVTSEDQTDAVDELFASLEEGGIFSCAGRLSLLV